MGSQFSLTVKATAGSPSPGTQRSLPARRGFVNLAGVFRGVRPTVTARVSEASALRQRLQDKKEDAWELFQRQQSWIPKKRDEFEREYRRKVTRQPEHFPFGPDEREEKSLQEWVDELLKNALAEDQAKEASERQKMEHPKGARLGAD